MELLGRGGCFYHKIVVTLPVMTRKHIVNRISEILHIVAPDCKAILYGSEARGDARPDSDIDVLVIVPDGVESFASRKYEIMGSLYDVELESGVTISPLVVKESIWSRLRTPFTCNVSNDGILL